MKQLSITLLLTVLMGMVGAKVSAHDIEVKNADGVTIYYNYNRTNGTEVTEVEVTYRGYEYDDYTSYAGHVNIPASVTYNNEVYSVTGIGGNAFRETALQSVIIPNSVTRISGSAFRETLLSYVIIPNSVTTIGNNAFYDCEDLNFVVSEITSPFAFGTNAFTNIFYPCVLTVPEGTRDAYVAAGWTESVFRGGISDSLEPSPNIEFADANVKAICIANYDPNGDGELNEAEAAALRYVGLWFKENVNITSFEELQYFTGLTSIVNQAFQGCSGLTSVTIPNSVTSIELAAFDGCSGLTSVTIPNSVTSIVNYAFSGCSSLTSVTAMMENPVSIGSYTFSNRANATLYVPYGCKVAYEAADYWKEFKEIVELPGPIEATDISQLDNAIYIESAEARCGSQATLSVKMKNSVAIQTIQFDLYLPDGITIVPNEDNELVTASKERINKFSYFQSSMQSDGALRLLAQATSTNVPAGDGEICRIVVDIPESMQEGEYPLIIKNALMVEKNNTSHSPDPNLVQSKLTLLRYVVGDASGDGEVNAIDFNMIGNYILGDSQSGLNVKAADISGDGEVNAIDFNMVGNMILNGGGSPSVTYYFSVGTTAPTASNYTTINGATTTIPTTKEFTNNSGGKASVYVLAPSNKTVTIKDTNMNIAFSDVYEDTSITIPNHKVWTKTSKVGRGGSITVVLN